MHTAYIVLPFLVFVFSAFLAGIVLKSNWGSNRHRLFAALLIAMSFWGLTIFGMRSSPSLYIAYQWEKVVFVAISFVSVFFFHFTAQYTNMRVSQWVIRGVYVWGMSMAVLSASGILTTGMQLKFYGYAPIFGRAAILYLPVAFSVPVVAVVMLARAFRRSKDSDERNRIGYVTVGASLTIAGGLTDLLPVMGINIYPLGIVSNIGFGIMTTIAMTRYRLMDLRVLLRRGFAYSLVSTVIFAAYGIMFLMFSTIFRYQNNTAAIIATVAALLVVTIFLPPAIGRIQQLVDRLFFRARYDHLLALNKFTQETRDIGDFPGLANSLVKTVTLAMQADWVSLLLPSSNDKNFVVSMTNPEPSKRDLSILRNSMFIRWLARKNRPLKMQELDFDPYLQAMGDSEREELKNFGAQLFVPLLAKGQVTGILALGPRLVEEDYSQNDIDLLTTVTSQAAIVIENSRLYSQEMARLKELEALDNLKSNLMRTISHELKSPLTSIKASADLLASSESQEELDQRKKRLYRALHSGVDRLERLVEESLGYAQMQSAHLQLNIARLDLRDVVDEAMKLVAPSYRAKNQKTNVSFPEEPCIAMMDPRRVERVVLNLLMNAMKFTPVEGEISVKMSKDDSQILTEVTDNGPGIPEGDKKFLFSEFYRGSKADGQKNAGTGLGLSIAKYLVELHGGSIGVRSSMGHGSTFYFSLPVAPVQAQQPVESSS